MALSVHGRVHRKRNGNKIRPYIPLTDNDIGDFNSLDLDKMRIEELKALKYSLEILHYDMVLSEPADRNSIEYRFWKRRLTKAEDFHANVQNLLFVLRDVSFKGPVYNAFRYLPVTEV